MRRKQSLRILPCLGLLAGALLTTTPVSAQLDTNDLYVGMGISYNDLASGWDNAWGAQLFGGYEIRQWDNLAVGVEVGYMDTGTFDHRGSPASRSFGGLWSTAVGTAHLTTRYYLLGRLGIDFGDDDGLMAGIGFGGRVTHNLDLRGELVERDDVTSLQANLVLRLGE